MNRLLSFAIASLAVGSVVLSVPAVAQQQTPPNPPAAAPVPAPAKPSAGGKQRKGHPHIHRAMVALKNAEKQLELAEAMYGGHRAKALEHVKQAQSELQQALEYAKQNSK